jgi:hypothetical protein
MGIIDWAKDSAAQIAINKALGSIGSIDKLTINRVAKSISGRLTLAGESSAISITITGYELGTGANGEQFRFMGMTADRPWLLEVGTKFLVGRWFPLPTSVPRSRLEMVL